MARARAFPMGNDYKPAARVHSGGRGDVYTYLYRAVYTDGYREYGVRRIHYYTYTFTYVYIYVRTCVYTTIADVLPPARNFVGFLYFYSRSFNLGMRKPSVRIHTRDLYKESRHRFIWR